MKDIENYKLSGVHEALQRLDRAVGRLESAAGKPPRAGDTAALEQKLADLRVQHGSLKETAGRVAGRLDDAIGRLSGMLEE